MARTKNQIANAEYGMDFEDLDTGEKAAITRRFNAQKSGSVTRRKTESGIVASIGRVGKNGLKPCALPVDATVADLVSQSGLFLDEKKEQVVEKATGYVVSLGDKVKDGAIYMISLEVKSA